METIIDYSDSLEPRLFQTSQNFAVNIGMSVDYSSFGLKDKIAIVTGGSQGIGRAIALGLAQAGCHIVLAKHPGGHHEEAQKVQSEIEALGRKAIIVLTDVAKVADVQNMTMTSIF